MRVSEVYASTQGEGPNVGETTVFVRFAGCNLRCSGWPCDTQHAIDPAFRKEWARPSVDGLSEQIRSVARLAGARLITFTGGEPFLQPRSELRDLTDRLLDSGFRLEAFTNGTLAYPTWAIDSISMIMDWKLPGSGEDLLNKNRIENVAQLKKSERDHAVKFVCKDMHDLVTAQAIWYTWLRDQRLTTYYGRVWEGDVSNAELVEYVMRERLPWKLNVQMHNYIWPAHERAR